MQLVCIAKSWPWVSPADMAASGTKHLARIETVLGSCMSSCASQAHAHGQKSGTDAYDWIRQSVGKRRPVYPTPDDRCASACASHGLGKRHAGPFYQKITNTSGSSSRRRRENAFIPSCKWLAARPLCRSGRVAYPPWTISPVEGQIGRLKMIKRTMFGRAGFKLLRARVLHAKCG